jgi:hypothetical protein
MVLTVIAITSSLLVIPNTACACEQPWMAFLSAFGLSGEESQDPSNLDGRILSLAARKHWSGKPLSAIVFPESMQPQHCVKRDASGLDCDFWISFGLLRDLGLRVKVNTEANGLVRDATVTNLNRLFGR